MLLAKIDGKTYPLKSCFWVRYAPNGCAVGSLLGGLAATPEQAHAEFTPRKRDREREVRQGYRHELVPKPQWGATVEPCLTGRCEHRQQGGTA